MAPDRAQENNVDGLMALPPIPTYDEAIAVDFHPDQEVHSLLDRSHRRSHSTSSETLRVGPSTRRRNGYRPPTVETDDEDSLWTSDDDDDETAHVRREMQEMDIDDSASARTNWRKRIPFSISLPQWKWNFRWRLPKFRIRLPDGPVPEPAGGETSTTTTRRRCCPSMDKQALILLIARLMAASLVLSLIYLLFASNLFTMMSRRLTQAPDPEKVKAVLQGSIRQESLRENLQHFTSYAHLAGSEGDYALALDMKNMFLRYGIEDVNVDEYQVYLNYPREGGRAVELLGDDGKPVWTAKLEEREMSEKEGEGRTAGRETWSFHGHSKSGDVKGPLIYANWGMPDDIQKLKESGIATEGAIALVRVAAVSADQSAIVRSVEQAGFVGCLTFTDFKDAFAPMAPTGRHMPWDGVQRGSVSMKSWVAGDPLTPGWASKLNVPRINPNEAKGLAKIPSMPLSWNDAKSLLLYLESSRQGQKVPEGWAAVNPGPKEWWTGNLTSPSVRLKNEQDEEEQQQIWNVYGRVLGLEQSAKSIVIGNHRDAWTEGATGPGSGTAVFMETARAFGELLAHGWRPLRTVEFMSWDGGEYNSVGATEYVESIEQTVRATAFAYINVDAAITSNKFTASGSPVFHKVLMQMLKRVMDPHVNATLHERWEAEQSQMGLLGAGSDFVAWQNIAGVSSLDLSFRSDDPYPAHSSYDTFDLVSRIIDPSFVYHALLTEVVGLVALELADRPIMPFDLSNFAVQLQTWAGDLERWAREKKDAPQQALGLFDELHRATDAVLEAAKAFEGWESAWFTDIMTSNGWETMATGRRRLKYNEQMGGFETMMLDLSPQGGLPNRTQFKHTVFGPEKWSTKASIFPAVRDYIDAGDWEGAQKAVAMAAARLQATAESLTI